MYNDDPYHRTKICRFLEPIPWMVGQGGTHKYAVEVGSGLCKIWEKSTQIGSERAVGVFRQLDGVTIYSVFAGLLVLGVCRVVHN